MKLRYQCLVLDHDDTVVISTPTIHYPSFREVMKQIRPNEEPITLEQFVNYSFDPGFAEMCSDVLQLSEEEIGRQYSFWKSYVATRQPEFYPGFDSLLKEYKEAGGLICVSSHSEAPEIRRDYIRYCGFEPDLIFDWALGAEKRKPNPYSITETMRILNLSRDDILVVDDLKPGLIMARSCGVSFAAAGWSHITPEIVSYMREHSDFYLRTVGELKTILYI